MARRGSGRIEAALCLLGLVALSAGGGCTAPGRATERLDILLIVLDTVRADRLGSYGSERELTPRLDALAARGVRFSRFFSSSGWTLPAHATIFTGLNPVAHRATQETLRLDARAPTLAEILGASGYRTFGASANPVVSVESGLARGFGEFVETFRRGAGGPAAGEGVHPNAAALRGFLEGGDGRPWFAFLNFIEAHAPYAPPPSCLARVAPGVDPGRLRRAIATEMPEHYLTPGGLSADRLALLGRLYDGEIACLDATIGGMLERLKREGRLDRAVVIIASDHGENLGEDGQFAHVFSLGNTLLQVPLIIVFPGGSHAGEVRGDTARMVDLFPTITAIAGIEGAPATHGRDLFASGAEEIDQPAWSEYYYPRQVLSVFSPGDLEAGRDRLLPYMRRIRSVQDGELKLLWSSDGSHRAFRTGRAPGSEIEITADAAPLLEGLDRRVAEFVARYQGTLPLPPPPPPGWTGSGFDTGDGDRERIERLRSLGYVQ